jgi:hypothetical protein
MRRILDPKSARATPEERCVLERVLQLHWAILAVGFFLLPAGYLLIGEGASVSGWDLRHLWTCVCAVTMALLLLVVMATRCPACGEVGGQAWFLFIITSKSFCCGLSLDPGPDEQSGTHGGCI